MKPTLFHGLITLLTAIALLLLAMAAGAGAQSLTINTQPLTHALPIVLLCAIIVLAINWLAFIPAWLRQTEHFFDLTGSLSFIAATGTAVYLTPTPDSRALLLATLIAIWAFRLGSFLFLRVRKDGQDGRFDTIKPHFMKFLMTWTLQALWVIASTAMALAAITTSPGKPLEALAFIGLTMWVTGFLIESVADWQKRQFKRRSTQPDDAQQPFISTGLWSWSRHPNYFGEILLWLGIACIAAPAISGWQWVTLISPMFVIVLLTKISGIPMLEKRADDRWQDNEAYQRYKQRTPVLIPRPPA